MTKSNERDNVLQQIRDVYSAATEADKQAVKKLVAQVKGASPGCLTVTMTPGMAAIIFVDHNKQNRHWEYKDSLAYADEMKGGHWHFSPQGIGFLKSGVLGDGQHRAGGIALSGASVQVIVAFGLEPKSIIALDRGRRRQAWETASIDGIDDAKLKQFVLKRAYSYYTTLYAQDAQHRAKYNTSKDRVVLDLMKSHDTDLVKAIEIGDESTKTISAPVFDYREAASFAFLLMLAEWPEANIATLLREFQKGEGQSEAAPLFVASRMLQQDAKKRDKRPPTARFAIAVKAFLSHTNGVKAVTAGSIAKAAEILPDPTYPVADQKKAA